MISVPPCLIFIRMGGPQAHVTLRMTAESKDVSLFIHSLRLRNDGYLSVKFQHRDAMSVICDSLNVFEALAVPAKSTS